jgi:hypothetical protein
MLAKKHRDKTGMPLWYPPKFEGTAANRVEYRHETVCSCPIPNSKKWIAGKHCGAVVTARCPMRLETVWREVRYPAWSGTTVPREDTLAESIEHGWFRSNHPRGCTCRKCKASGPPSHGRHCHKWPISTERAQIYIQSSLLFS